MTKKWNSRRVEDIEKDPKKMAGKWQLYLSLIKIKIIIEMYIKKNCSKKKSLRMGFELGQFALYS